MTNMGAFGLYIKLELSIYISEMVLHEVAV